MSFDSPYALSYFDGTDLVAVTQVYADASEIGGYLSVGAIVFRKKYINAFEKEWRAMLRRYGLTYFHMTDCNAGKGEYSALSDEECDSCARLAIKIILKYASSGTIFSVKQSDFYEIITKKGISPNPFTFGAWRMLFDVAHWADDNDPSARITYIFEAGDDHQSDANIMFSSILEDAERCSRFRYRGHAFLPKKTSLPTQAADILAWHGAKHAHRKSLGNEGGHQCVNQQPNAALWSL